MGGRRWFPGFRAAGGGLARRAFYTLSRQRGGGVAGGVGGTQREVALPSADVNAYVAP